MSLSQVRNVVLLFSNPVWSGANTVPTTFIRNITALSRQFSYADTLLTNLTTLTTTSAETLNGIIQGLLYVPDIPYGHPCYEAQYDLIPRNVTRQAQLPPTNYNLIALAPWFNATCTQAYLQAARLDPIRAFLFYRPNNSTNKPQAVDSPIWDLDDNGAWQTDNHFPIFAIPGRSGADMMDELAAYSGNLSQIPYGRQITDGLDPHPNDYVRIWTELTMADPQSMPAMWTYILIVAGATLFLIACISIGMHMVQRGRRRSLQERIIKGEVDLEAMGIKRMTVPDYHVKSFPLFTYSYDPEISSAPVTPSSPRSPRSPRLGRRDRSSSDLTSPTSRRRPSFSGSVSTIATNFQPTCHICLEIFEHRVSVIRELPCQHIFHPECIDEFLSANSSLCPICKLSMLPRGYCPRITNGIVRRERAIRRLRERVVVEDSESEKSKRKSWGRRFFMSGADGIPPEPDLSALEMGTVDQAAPPPTTPKTPRTPSTNFASLRMAPPAALVMETVPEGTATSSPTSEPLDDGRRQQPMAIAEALERQPTQTTQAATTTAATAAAARPVTPPAQVATAEPQPPPPVTPKRSRRRRPRALKLQPALPEAVLNAQRQRGYANPSDQTRQRMRTLAGSPFEDPEGRRSLWNRALIKIFPGFS